MIQSYTISSVNYSGDELSNIKVALVYSLEPVLNLRKK